jgi:hypothetical protein
VYGRPDLTIRPTLRQVLPQLVIAVLAIGVAAALRDAALVAACALGLGYVLLTWRRFGTHLTSGDVVVLGIRNRIIAWEDVKEVREHRQFGARGLVLTETTGRRTLLKAPHDSRLAPDEDYETKRDQIIEAWDAARGEGWRASGSGPASPSSPSSPRDG